MFETVAHEYENKGKFIESIFKIDNVFRISLLSHGHLKVVFAYNKNPNYAYKMNEVNIYGAEKYFQKNNIEVILKQCWDFYTKKWINVGVNSSKRQQFYLDLIDNIKAETEYYCKKVDTACYIIQTDRFKIRIGVESDLVETETNINIGKNDVEKYEKTLIKMRDLING